MKMFYTSASAKAEIFELEGQIATLEANAVSDAAEIARFTAEIATANESLAAMTTDRDEAAAALQTAEASLATANAELATAQAAVAGFDEKVELAAQAKFAGLGGPPITGSQKDDTQTKGDLSGLIGFAKVSAAFAQKK